MSELVLDDVHVVFRSPSRGEVHAVAGVDLTVTSGRITGLVGESGCGKSTLARVASGLSAPTAGTVTLDGSTVRPIGWRRRAPAERRVQMVFQDPYSSLNPRRTIGSQLADGLPGRTDARARIRELVTRVGMDPAVVGHYPHEFSGGQRQRLAIARALAAGPDILIADEPVTALDASAQAQVIQVLLDLVRDTGVGVLFISHDLALVHEIADVTAVMYLGRVVESGPTRQLLREPRHPYTASLVRAIPEVRARPQLPEALAGEVPDPANTPSGCPFHPRCPHAVAGCLEEQVLTPVTVERQVACHRWVELTGVLSTSTTSTDTRTTDQPPGRAHA